MTDLNSELLDSRPVANTHNLTVNQLAQLVQVFNFLLKEELVTTYHEEYRLFFYVI